MPRFPQPLLIYLQRLKYLWHAALILAHCSKTSPPPFSFWLKTSTCELFFSIQLAPGGPRGVRRSGYVRGDPELGAVFSQLSRPGGLQQQYQHVLGSHTLWWLPGRLEKADAVQKQLACFHDSDREQDVHIGLCWSKEPRTDH